jgi:hypothetical protein
MLSIEEIRELQEEKIQSDLAFSLEQKRKTIVNMEEVRQQNIAKAEETKTALDKEFPRILEKIQQDIRNEIRNGNNSTTCYINSNLEGLYTLVMLVSVLPLHGYVCRMNDRYLQISW